MTFLGYERADGSYGVRNHVLVIPGGYVADQICHVVYGTKTIITGQGPLPRPAGDRATFARLYVGLALNPNVGAVIIDGASQWLDTPEVLPEVLAEQVAKSGKRVEVLEPQGVDTLSLVSKGVKLAREMTYEISKLRRKPCSEEHLAVGVKCGHSDPTSGMVGNPTVGYLYDKLVKAGGTAFFGETTEIIGAERVLAKRASSKKVAEDLLRVTYEMEERAKSTGEDMRTVNPVPSNIKAGITTLEEKSLGAIHKAGSMPIRGVLKFAEQPGEKGLYFVDNSASTLSIFLGYAAAGAQIVLYQLGGGGVRNDEVFYETGSVIAPFIWCSANPKTLRMGGFNLDFYSGTVIEGKETIEEVGERLYKTVIDVASGTLTRTETLNHVDPNEVYMLQPVF